LEEEGARVIRHTGGTVGFTALLAIRPDDGVAVAICMNGEGVRGTLGSVAIATVVAALRGEPFPDVPVDRSDRIFDADELAGVYASGGRSIVLEPDAGGLVLRAGPLAVRLEPWPDATDTFAVPHPALDLHLLRVERDGDARPSALTHGPAWYGRADRVQASEDVRLADDADRGRYPGLYRADGPWNAAIRIYLRRGRLWFTRPTEGVEFELSLLDDGWFAVGDPKLPRRCRFADVVEGLAQTIEYNGALLSRSFEG
jgi:hypothetical protein